MIVKNREIPDSVVMGMNVLVTVIIVAYVIIYQTITVITNF